MLSPLGDLFINMMFCIVVPMVFVSVSSAIANMDSPKQAGKVMGVKAVTDEQEIMMITTAGIIIRIRMSDIRTMSRITSGVKLINLAPGVTVAKIAKVRAEEEDEDAEYAEVEDADEAEEVEELEEAEELEKAEGEEADEAEAESGDEGAEASETE